MYLSRDVIDPLVKSLKKYRKDTKWQDFFSALDTIYQRDDEYKSQFPKIFNETNDSLKENINALLEKKEEIMNLTASGTEYNAVEKIIDTIWADYSHLF